MEFLESLQKIPTAREMGQWDKAAMDFGMPETMLMENAGQAIAGAVAERFGSFRNKNVCLFMGSGNNGGDAACLARIVMDSGGQAVVYCLRAPDGATGSPGWHMRLARNSGAIFRHLDASLDAPAFMAAYARDFGCLPDLICDGLLGTGFSGTLRPALARVIQMVNALAKLIKCPLAAIDIPSGLNAETGQPLPDAIRASLTVTLAAPKPGLLQPKAAPWTGELVCRGIGLPAAIGDKCPATWRLLDGSCLAYEPDCEPGSFKNRYGHILVIGGARGYAGAGHLACAGALRAGAGLVTACAPQECLAAIKGPEIMVFPAGPGSAWPQDLPRDWEKIMTRVSALVIGPGMGRGGDAAAFLEKALSWPDRPPAVIDADALALIAGNQSLLAYLGPDDIMTPHPGEAAMLLGCHGSEIQADRPAALERLCGLGKAAAVLKGAVTLAGQAAGARLICPYDIPELAIGGAGDVLSGCIGALLGSELFKKFSSLAKAGYGVTLHAMAGLYLAEKYPHRGALASDLANALGHARQFVLQQPRSVRGSLPWPR